MGRHYLVIFSILPICFIFFSGCVEHAGYAAGLKALEKNDITLCNSLKEQADVKECYYTFADGKNDPNYCLRAPDPTTCVSEYAAKRQQMSPCDVLRDPGQKYTCLARVAGDQTGRSIEEIIADFRSQGASRKCQAQCSNTRSTCDRNCDMNKKALPSYEENGRVIIPTDVEYLDCKNTCTDAYVGCNDDCLSAAG